MRKHRSKTVTASRSKLPYPRGAILLSKGNLKRTKRLYELETTMIDPLILLPVIPSSKLTVQRGAQTLRIPRDDSTVAHLDPS